MFQQLQCILAAKANRLMAEEDCDGLGVARFRFWACLRPANFARELVCKYKVLFQWNWIQTIEFQDIWRHTSFFQVTFCNSYRSFRSFPWPLGQSFWGTNSTPCRFLSPYYTRLPGELRMAGWKAQRHGLQTPGHWRICELPLSATCTIGLAKGKTWRQKQMNPTLSMALWYAKAEGRQNLHLSNICLVVFNFVLVL